MDIDFKDPAVQFSLEIVQFAAELARRIRFESSSVKSILKQDRSPVTLADMGIQAVAGALLEEYLPGAALVAEEDADYLRTPEGEDDLQNITGIVHSFLPHARPERVCGWIDRGRTRPPEEGPFWTLDPIDGTKGFLRGGQYATALALIRDGKVELAALGCPELGFEGHKELGKGVGIFAARGRGCLAFSLEDIEDPKRWVPLRVSSCHDIHKARVLDSFDPEHRNPEKERLIRTALGISTEPIFMDSMAKHAVIAAGDAEIFFRTLPCKDPDHREKIWDVAAGALAIEEAGGRVTDLNGQELDFSAGLTLAKNPGFVATNGFFHESILEELRKAVQL